MRSVTRGVARGMGGAALGAQGFDLARVLRLERTYVQGQAPLERQN